eukprot:TRINITY_DN14232_c0_g1_i2.p1 TRINITY_DN14232_c0_g1~~TRINITY_DN14232_c0_g1_i2.p1  ORF type:complete len:646 (+),score=119.95 TRINITY_DN14232_c0_g1_i2:82-1938(+)
MAEGGDAPPEQERACSPEPANASPRHRALAGMVPLGLAGKPLPDAAAAGGAAGGDTPRPAPLNGLFPPGLRLDGSPIPSPRSPRRRSSGSGSPPLGAAAGDGRLPSPELSPCAAPAPAGGAASAPQPAAAPDAPAHGGVGGGDAERMAGGGGRARPTRRKPLGGADGADEIPSEDLALEPPTANYPRSDGTKQVRASVVSALFSVRQVVCASVHSPGLYLELVAQLPRPIQEQLRDFGMSLFYEISDASNGHRVPLTENDFDGEAEAHGGDGELVALRGLKDALMGSATRALAGIKGGLVNEDTNLLYNFLALYPSVELLLARQLAPDAESGGEVGEDGLTDTLRALRLANERWCELHPNDAEFPPHPCESGQFTPPPGEDERMRRVLVVNLERRFPESQWKPLIDFRERLTDGIVRFAAGEYRSPPAQPAAAPPAPEGAAPLPLAEGAAEAAGAAEPEAPAEGAQQPAAAAGGAEPQVRTPPVGPARPPPPVGQREHPLAPRLQNIIWTLYTGLTNINQRATPVQLWTALTARLQLNADQVKMYLKEMEAERRRRYAGNSLWARGLAFLRIGPRPQPQTSEDFAYEAVAQRHRQEAEDFLAMCTPFASELAPLRPHE